MRDAIKQLDQTESQATRAQQLADLAIAQAWYNTIKKPTPTNRPDALDNFNYIKSLLQTETERYKRRVLNTELEKANEKYKEVKRNG